MNYNEQQNNNTMKVKSMNKSHPFYQQALEHFRDQYKDVDRLICLYANSDLVCCGGEWIDSNGDHCIGKSDEDEITHKILIRP